MLLCRCIRTKSRNFYNNLQATLDVNGDVKVQGSLTVAGDSTFINASTLRVEDKNIELGLLDDSTEGNDSAIDDGGIILRSSDGSKDFTWKQATEFGLVIKILI